MSNFAWIIAILLAALFFWALASTAIHRLMTVDETILSMLKMMLRHRDINPDRIPTAALIDIVVKKIEEAKRKSVRPEPSAQSKDDWRRHLLRLLDAEADLVERILQEGSQKFGDTHAAQVLLKYGVVEPPIAPAMSMEQFVDAAKRGQLYAELEERISRREFT